MITLSGLTKRFGASTAVDNLTLDIAPGRVTGFLGPNGAGKSTTMRMILGLDRPTAGTALVDGRPYATLRHPLRDGRRAAGRQGGASGPDRPGPPAGDGPQQRHPDRAGSTRYWTPSA